jgi:hypothetical protein
MIFTYVDIICILQEGQSLISQQLNLQSKSIILLDKKLNALNSYLQEARTTAPLSSTSSGMGISHIQDETENHASEMIRAMASPNPQNRTKGNYLQCLEALGFPVNSSIEDVSWLCHRFYFQ